MKQFYKSVFMLAVFVVLFVSCEKEMFIEPKNTMLTIEYGKIYIDSKPSGASIYVNGRNTGYVTPDTVNYLEDGNANIVLKKEYFDDTTFTLRVQKQYTESIVVDYYANPKMYGKIICGSKPAGAVIYLNNKNTGRVTPDTLERIFPGEYTIKYSYPEFRKDSLTFMVKSKVTSSVNLALEDTLDIITYTPKNSKFPSYSVSEMEEDKDGNFWIGTYTKGLVKFNGKYFTNYRCKVGTDSPIPSDYVSQIKKDKNNNLWFGFSSGLIKYDGTTWEKTSIKQINSIHIAYDNTILAATDGNGVLRYKNGIYDRLTKSNSGLHGDYLFGVCLDKSSKIWASPMEYGLSVYDGSSWIHLDSANNKLPFGQACCLGLTPEGEVLCMFYKYTCPPAPATEHILARFNGKEWIPIATGMNKTEVRQIYRDKENGIWFCLNGMKRFINNTSKSLKDMVSTHLRCFNSYNRNTLLAIKDVFIDSGGNLWLLGGDYGLVKIKKGRWSY